MNYQKYPNTLVTKIILYYIMASVLDKAHFPDGISKGAIKTNNQIRSNQYVHDYYHIAKGLLPKGIANGVEIVSDTISDTITGVFTNTPWRRKITRDRLLHAIEFEQINPLAEAAKETIAQVTQGINRIKSIISTDGANTKGRRAVRNLMEQERTNYLTTNKDTNILRKDNQEAPSLNKSLKYHKYRMDYLGKPMENTSLMSIEKETITIMNRISSSPYTYIKLQNRPGQVEINPETNWATIKSMGRNNPMYHYTGAEDTISFNISWYCDNKENLMEVLAKCRLLESWSKANGYTQAPPILEIIWGSRDYYNEPTASIFNGQYFILWSAKYTLHNIRMPHPSYTQDIENTYPGLYPQTATQELVFKRVTDHNLTRSEIAPDKLMSKVTGYGGTHGYDYIPSPNKNMIS